AGARVRRARRAEPPLGQVRTDGVHLTPPNLRPLRHTTAGSGTHVRERVRYPPSVTETQPRATRPPKQEQQSASPEVTEVAPGILRMQLPIWMPGLGHVNMYALVDDRGLTVVDPGLPGPQSWKALKTRLKSAGYSLKNIHTVLVTHSHPDHFGGAGRIARETGAELITHHAFSPWTVKGPAPHTALTEREARRAEVEAAAPALPLAVEPDSLPTTDRP